MQLLTSSEEQYEIQHQVRVHYSGFHISLADSRNAQTTRQRQPH
jgi:hypothetical protein